MKKNEGKTKKYLIQGVFFETDGMYYFHGAIGCEEKHGVDFGRMEDPIGKSKIFAFQISPDTVTFSKQYEDRDTFIHYKYREEGGWWKGHFTLPNGRHGSTNCVITEVSTEFFISQ